MIHKSLEINLCASINIASVAIVNCPVVQSSEKLDWGVGRITQFLSEFHAFLQSLVCWHRNQNLQPRIIQSSIGSSVEGCSRFCAKNRRLRFPQFNWHAPSRSYIPNGGEKPRWLISCHKPSHCFDAFCSVKWSFKESYLERRILYWHEKQIRSEGVCLSYYHFHVQI